MAKGIILLEVVCGECRKKFIPVFDNTEKKFYMVCPATKASGFPCSQGGQKFKIPEQTVELEEYN